MKTVDEIKVFEGWKLSDIENEINAWIKTVKYPNEVVDVVVTPIVNINTLSYIAVCKIHNCGIK